MLLSRQEAEDAELILLRFLCQSQREAGARSAIFEALRRYRFVAMFQQVLFDCLTALPATLTEMPDMPKMTEVLLAERLVRAGFPDFDLQPYLSGAVVSGAEADSLCRRLLAGDAGIEGSR